MSDVMQEFLHLNGLDHPQLLGRRQQLLSTAPDARGLSDEALQELLVIARILRKRAIAPAAKATSSRRAAAPSLDAL
jgi:hypothetical protein